MGQARSIGRFRRSRLSSWGEPFIVFGLVVLAAVSLVAFGYLGKALGHAGRRLAAEGPTPALGLHIRNLVWLSRILLVVAVRGLFMMTVKLGTKPRHLPVVADSTYGTARSCLAVLDRIQRIAAAAVPA